MVSGDWDITIISNNGDGDPIAYQAEFYITAGPQQTVTVCAFYQQFKISECSLFEGYANAPFQLHYYANSNFNID